MCCSNYDIVRYETAVSAQPLSLVPAGVVVILLLQVCNTCEATSWSARASTPVAASKLGTQTGAVPAYAGWFVYVAKSSTNHRYKLVQMTREADNDISQNGTKKGGGSRQEVREATYIHTCT
jgi:hypothetical protein